MHTTSRVAIVSFVTLVPALAACKGFDKMNEAEVDTAQKSTAQAIATRIYEGCNSGQHQALRDDQAIKEMQEAFSPERMKETCASITKQFGSYQSMDYVEAHKGKTGPLRIYRFKGHFSGTAETPEIRVVMEGQKLSGFWLRPWSDTLR